MSKLLFETVFKRGNTNEEFETGFEIARKFPNHKIMQVTESEDDYLFMFFRDDEVPSTDDIVAALKAETAMSEWVDIYLADLSEQMNQELDDIILNE